MKSLRIAMLVNVAPRKLGSLERWMLAMGREAGVRQHRLHLFTHEPLHAAFREGLEQLKIDWTALQTLFESPLRAILSFRRLDALHLNLFAPRATPCLLAYLSWPAPVIHVDRFSDPSGESGGRRLITRTLDRLTVRRIARYVGVSTYVVRRAQSRFGPNGTSYETILNGIDEQVFAAPRPPGEDQHLRLLAAAHLIPEKGLHYALDAVAELLHRRIPVRLKVAGDGPQRGRLEEQSARLGIQSHVEFLGLRDDVPDLMRRSDVFIHPATWGEAFGFTVAEAMAAGCAVVASRIGGIPELITNRETGLLVEPRSTAAIVAAVTGMFRDPGLRIRIGSAARQHALSHLGVARCVAAHLDCIEAVAGRQR